ncbi:NapC/NirT family cytochrome c [Desulfuromonas acetoxidans]|mgnify:CR=1 FL=1|uniref:Cytochrome c-type protein n=1 Tax=Desulfuromonas acetoxidans (strain DSM 684 / 11070) TaxID=281689 RepID=Q1JWQ6_DESA6|nr:NapC/NirT family cytochrome c [Desulfuromonas acetoxidans]EAT14623.1 NapC/NirT cytochrome c-like [Desulfuromonas acetoxidans DSM 684]EAT16990.1 NapC/NirT cytochrome c-like [Desulfuromonas acetoxidans DSM 684]MBF0645705.1 NapC/NirT family cytochrome c [Desulfuromonas acetoxidans]NVD23995.1 NapC/NirT family cytochrome c [Desulfuromonas acetoxidans]NVE16292.1 NapC/NirT family cytochrome c [Desulfuromonas acetoxidans]
MKRWMKAVLLVATGVILGVPLMSMGYYTMVRTSTPQFCAMCHEIRPAYRDWQTSSHGFNTQGVVADCMDCHLPAPHDTFDFFYAKAYHGVKDVVAHLFLDEYDREKNRHHAWADISNDQCMKCHRNLLYMPDKRGAMMAHRTVVYAREGYEKLCTDCHRYLVHKPKSSYSYSQKL